MTTISSINNYNIPGLVQPTVQLALLPSVPNVFTRLTRYTGWCQERAAAFITRILGQCTGNIQIYKLYCRFTVFNSNKLGDNTMFNYCCLICVQFSTNEKYLFAPLAMAAMRTTRKKDYLRYVPSDWVYAWTQGQKHKL